MSDLKTTNESLQDLVKLFAIMVKRDRTQSSLIAEMGEVGISPTKIAALLGTSANTVNVTLSKIRSTKKK